jgi:hypothetical protein
MVAEGQRHRAAASRQVIRAARQYSLARLWQKQGKQTEATQLLSAIYGCFTEGLESADLTEGRTLLNELATASSP